MICKSCGADNQDGSLFCQYCGSKLNEEETDLKKSESAPADKQQQSADADYQTALNLTTNYSLLKYILLGLITLGIYDIVVLSSISTNINIVASRYDGKKTMHYCLLFFVFSWLTLGIAVLVWYHKISERIGNELARRNLQYKFSAGTFWLWGFLGALIIVGPFVYIYKMCQAMNMLDADYNKRG